jgi:hypothetical protein
MDTTMDTEKIMSKNEKNASLKNIIKTKLQELWTWLTMSKEEQMLISNIKENIKIADVKIKKHTEKLNKERTIKEKDLTIIS